MLGRLDTKPALDRPDLLAEPVRAVLAAGQVEAMVAEIDPAQADTAAFCAAYDVPLEMSANCVVVTGRRGERTTMAGCVVRATDRADVNGVVRRHLNARKASFAPADVATALSAMEYGGITPVGLPADWPLLLDEAVVATPYVVVGSGLRRSKLVVEGAALAGLPRAEVLDLVTRPSPGRGGRS